MNKRADLFWATLGEGGLVLALAAIGWVTKQPLIFASLGPTAYELVEQPQLKSARSYNIVVGHLIGLGAGFLAIYVLKRLDSTQRVGCRRCLQPTAVGDDDRSNAHHILDLDPESGSTRCVGDDAAGFPGSNADSSGGHGRSRGSADHHCCWRTNTSLPP